jgi:uncharacterized membrane protein
MALFDIFLAFATALVALWIIGIVAVILGAVLRERHYRKLARELDARRGAGPKGLQP